MTEIVVAHDHPEGAAWRIGSEITQADVASLASTSVRTIEKILRVLESEGIVSRRRRDLMITDLPALEDTPDCFAQSRLGGITDQSDAAKYGRARVY